jgi:putative PIN family toxin of toxin-antitoxin system
MAIQGLRLILDTNTLLRGLAKPGSASGRLVTAVEERKVLLLTSTRVVDEYRLILMDPIILSRYPQLSVTAVEASIRNLVYLSEDFRLIRTRFEFPRDPKDEKFLALAIAGRATHLISFDKDLLSLPTSHSEAAKRLRQRLPSLRIEMPGEFLQRHGREIGY